MKTKQKMRQTICLLAFVILNLHFAIAQTSYGKKVNEREAISVQELSTSMKGKTEMEATVSGKVTSVCQAEGCWMKVDNGDGTSMMVRMKDHKFVLPKDISGKNAIFTGTASVKTTSVEVLKHYAEDEGKSKEYIEAIKEPKTELAFDATGVIIL